MEGPTPILVDGDELCLENITITDDEFKLYNYHRRCLIVTIPVKNGTDIVVAAHKYGGCCAHAVRVIYSGHDKTWYV